MIVRPCVSSRVAVFDHLLHTRLVLERVVVISASISNIMLSYSVSKYSVSMYGYCSRFTVITTGM